MKGISVSLKEVSCSPGWPQMGYITKNDLEPPTPAMAAVNIGLQTGLARADLCDPNDPRFKEPSHILLAHPL